MNNHHWHLRPKDRKALHQHYQWVTRSGLDRYCTLCFGNTFGTMPARWYELLSSFKVDQRAGGSTRATQGWRHQNNPVRAVDRPGTDVTTLANVSPLPQTLCHFYSSFCWWARLLHPPQKTTHHLCSSTVDITHAEIHHSQELNKRETADRIPKNTMILEHMQKAIWCNKASYCCTVKACPFMFKSTFPCHSAARTKTALSQLQLYLSQVSSTPLKFRKES